MRRARGLPEYLLAVVGTTVGWQVFSSGLISDAVPRIAIVIVPPLALAAILVLRRTARSVAGGGSTLRIVATMVAEALLLALAVGLVTAAARSIIFGEYLP